MGVLTPSNLLQEPSDEHPQECCQHRITFPHFRRSKFPHPVAVPVLSRWVMRRSPFEAGQAGV